MSLLKQPSWLRALEIVTGVLAVILCVIVLAYPGLGVASLVVVLAVALIFVGIRSLIVASHKGIPKSYRVLNAVFGVLALIFGIIIPFLPGVALLTLVELLAIGLLFYGVGRIWMAYQLKTSSTGFRALIATVGVLGIILSALVLALPGVALLTLVAMLAVILLFYGIEMIVSGAVGRTWLGEVVASVTGDKKL